MAKTDFKRKNWLKKKYRSKRSLGPLGKYPRLIIFRSNKHIYSQLVDDNKNQTILSSSSKDKSFKIEKCNKIDLSKKVAFNLVEKLKNKKIKKVIFDRNGYLYHGRVKAFADAVREKGIEI